MSEIKSTARMIALKEALAKFDTLPCILAAANAFYDFLTESETAPATVETPAATNEFCLYEVPAEQREEQPAPEAPQIRTDIEAKTALRPLTAIQAAALQAMIDIWSNGANKVTMSQVAAARKVSMPLIQSPVEALISKGYARADRFNNRIKFYTPLYTPGGASLQPLTSTNENGVTVTRGPTRFAHGYGQTSF